MRVAWLILVIALSTTLLAWSLARRAVESAAAARFEVLNDELVHAVVTRMETYQQVLRGGVGLFRASEQVTWREWRQYVSELDIEGNYPGILGIGFAAHVPRARREQFLAGQAGGLLPTFPLRPPGERAVYVPVTYIEPFNWRNQRALGYDMYSETLRREAIDRARDTGGPALSAPVTLAQETGDNAQPGVLMYLPIYRGAPRTVEERRTRLRGFVYAPFRVTDLMQGTLGSSLHDMQLTLFDGRRDDPARRIYDNLRARTAPAVCAHDAQRTIQVAGRDWTLRICRPTRLATDRATDIILGTGTVISLLLFGITWSLANTRARAMAMAGRMTSELNEERTRLAEITAAMGEGLYVQDTHGTITYSNPAAAQLLGWEPESLPGRSSSELLAPEARAAGIGTSAREPADAGRHAVEETLYLRRDGTPVPVSVVSAPILRDGRTVGSVVAFHDVSEQRRAASALREAQQFSALFQYSRDAYFLVDLNDMIIDVNRVALDSLGYTRAELLGSRSARFVRWSTAPQPGQGLDAFFETLTTAATVRGEAEYVRKDGTSFFVEAAFSPLLHEQAKMILISARDITERKEAERRIQRALDDLEHSRREVEETNRRLAESNRELQNMSRRDGLTGIANRRSFEEYFGLEWNRAARDHRPLSLLMVDVDHFKAYNDRYGHPVGDDCLRRVAETLDRQLSRSIDVVARYGGEEFVVVLPETPLAGAVNIGERLRRATEELALPHAASPLADHVTISIGAASVIPQPGDPRELLVARADSALYRAKQNGRNRVCPAETPEP